MSKSVFVKIVLFIEKASTIESGRSEIGQLSTGVKIVVGIGKGVSAHVHAGRTSLAVEPKTALDPLLKKQI